MTTRRAHGAPSTVGRLSRRDRAAMVLALECIRARHGLNRAMRALEMGPPHGTSVTVVFRIEDAQCVAYPPSDRILRARLALTLRVLLRVDAGDFGPRARCAACGSASVTRSPKAHAPWCYGACSKRTRYGSRRYRPLWEHAAATGDRRDGSAARAAGGETR